MPLLPPDLVQSFSSAEMRASARSLLSRRDRVLGSIRELASKPTESWTTNELSLFPDTTNGVPDPAPQRVERWSWLFAEELEGIHALASRTSPISDLELREALFLAQRLLALVTDWAPSEVDQFEIAP